MASSYLIHTIQTILGLGDGLLDLESSFVEAGGDSMKAILVASGCQQHGVAITRSQLLKAKSIQELVASFSVPLTHEDQSGQAQQDDGSSSTERDSLTPNTPPTTEIYHVIDGTPSQYDDLLLEKSPSLLPHQAPVYGVHAEAVVPQSVAAQVAENVLTEMQLSLIHGTHRNSGSNIISYTATYYAEDIQRLKSAWERVIRSESIFWGSQWALLESHYQAAFQWEEVAEERGPQPASNKLGDGVLKVCFQVSPPTHGADGRLQSRIRCSIHHAIVDGRSFHMLLDKVHQIASGLYPEMSPSFWDWSSALRQLQSAKKTEGDTFWLERQARFPDSEGNLLLANPGAVGGERSSSLVIKLGSDSHRLAASARAVGVTPALMFYAAWAMVMATYTDSDTVVFGAVLSSIHLPLPGAMSVVGPQINLLPLHVALRMDMTVETFLRSLFEDILRLDELAWTTPDNGFSRQFESALSVELPAGDSESQHLSVQPLASETEVESDVPLSVMITQCDNICIRYHRSRFHQRDVHVLADCYRNSLLSLLTTSQPIGVVLAGLVSAETDTMLKQLGNCSSGLTTRASVSDDLVTLFEQTTRACPDEVALDNGHEQLSYQALHDASGRVAAALTARNLSPGDVVGVHSDRSINWIVAIYGVLRADCVYCSMDPSIPASLRETMYSTAGAKAFLTPAKSQLAVAPKCCDVTLSVDSVLRDDDMLTRPEEKQQAMPHRVTSRPWAPAYVCFTSGSTGTPKGVLCTHEGLVAFQRNLKVRLHAKPGVRVSQTMSVAFDGSIHEIFSALSYGATLVLASGEDPLEPLGTATSAILTPSIARLLDPGDYPNLKWVYLVGEAVPQNVSDKWSSSHALFNMYGPTEGTGGATIKRLLPGEPVTIGVPNPSTRVYILNSRRGFSQPGMIGEIYLAGVQVARGYINMAEATSERFVPDSVMRNMEMMYRTGDRGYWSPMGELVCLGRNDRQIKLRGYRLDLDGLEAKIAAALPSLEGVAVARHGDQLVAMVQPASLSAAEVRSALTAVLPHYAMPHWVLPVPEIPCTAAGKTDYRAVAGAAACTPAAANIALPGGRLATEDVVCDAIRHILGLGIATVMTRSTHLWELGGNSMHQIRLARRLSETLGVDLPLRTVVLNPTVGDLIEAVGKLVEKSKTVAAPALPKAKGAAPLGKDHYESSATEHVSTVSPMEGEWLDKYSIDRGAACFNVCFMANLGVARVEHKRLARAWNVVLARHKMLRCRYHSLPHRRRGPFRRSFSRCSPRVELRGNFDPWAEANRPFQLDSEHPVRVILSRSALFVALSHVVADYTTLALLLREASAVYKGRLQLLDRPTRAYSDVSLWHEPAPPSYQAFWSDHLADLPAPPAIVGDHGGGGERIGYRGRSALYRIGERETRAILEYSQTAGVTPQQLALAAVALSLTSRVAPTDIVLGVPFINRKSRDDAETVGLFLEPLPVRISAGGDGTDEPTTRHFARDIVRTTLQAALANAIPWHQLLDLLRIRPNYPDHPLFEIMVSFHEQHMRSELDVDIAGVEPCLVWSQGAKFKLMLEFVAISDSSILLRAEYDDECVDAAELAQQMRKIPRCMELLASGEFTRVEIKAKLNAEDGAGEPSQLTLDDRDLFGARICDV